MRVGEIRMTKNKLRISHYPQVPCKAFVVEVETLEEAKKVMDILANYDSFQYENKIKPDYCNMSILEQWDDEEKEWFDWVDEETGIDDLDECFEFINEVDNN